MSVGYHLFERELVKLAKDFKRGKIGPDGLNEGIRLVWSSFQNICPFCHERLDPIKKPVRDYYAFDKGTDCWCHKKCQEDFLREDNDES